MHCSAIVGNDTALIKGEHVQVFSVNMMIPVQTLACSKHTPVDRNNVYLHEEHCS
jgi:hypothetical protein